MLTISKPLSAGQAHAITPRSSATRARTTTRRATRSGASGTAGSRRVGTDGRRPGDALRTPRGRPASDHRRATGPASDAADAHQRARRAVTDDGTPRRLGCDVLGAEECLADGAGRWRRARARGAPRERRGGARRDGAVRAGPHRAAIILPRPPGKWSPRGSSTTAPGRWMATRRRNSTRTP